MPESRYGVKVSRGPRLRLEPHPDSCELEEVRMYAARSDRPLAIDLFCCGGGLSLGLEEAGFRVILGVDRDEYAIETHRAYFGGVSLRADLSDPDEVSRITAALEGIDISLVAGSPPCQPFSRAGSSKIRSLVQQGVRSFEDERRELWRSFVTVVMRLKPQAVLMENVPDLVAGDNSIIFRQIVSSIEAMGYDVHTRILPCWQYRIPQHRQRLFIVGVHKGVPFNWPRPSRKNMPGVGEAISDLPPVEAGVLNEGLPYGHQGQPLTALQRWCRKGQPRGRLGKIYDHFTRPVRPDDLQAFQLMHSRTRYSDLPKHLRRYKTDHFDDKYKRLDLKEPSRTITAHIAHDGYWYIHPTQHRTLTVREAARIQSFPDRFRFAGTPTHAFRQIGEAVPPLIARAVGKSVARALASDNRDSLTVQTQQVSHSLSQWIEQLPETELRSPWRLGKGPWQIMMGMVVFERMSASVIATTWPAFRDRWPDANAYLADPQRHSTLRIGNGEAGALLDEIANALAGASPNGPSAIARIPGLSSERWEMALTLAGQSHNLRLTAATRRLVERMFGELPPNSHFGAQMAIARLVGVQNAHRAYAAALEVSEQFCRPQNPLCETCPLRAFCLSYREEGAIERRRKTSGKAGLWNGRA